MKNEFAVIFGFLLLAGCHKESAPPPPAPAASKSTVPSTSPSAEPDKVKIKTAAGDTVVEIRGGDEVKIEFESAGVSRVLRGKTRESGKRKYEAEGAGVVAEVKPGDEGFKVRTPDGKLLWKVKISAEKIKISDNEENRNPYELKTKYADKVKVVDANDRELGDVKFYRDRKRVEVKDPANADLYKINTERYSAAFGVLLMDRIPPEHKMIIMAELLGRGK